MSTRRLAAGFFLLSFSWGCSATAHDDADGPPSNPAGNGGAAGATSSAQGGLGGLGGATIFDDGGPPACKTTLTGTVVSGTLPIYGPPVPIYNALVYLPSTALEPLPEGVTCDKCGAPVSGKPIAAALTDAAGQFTISSPNIPTGKDVPLVIQVGKWRREVVIPEVTACETAAVDEELTRLPRNRLEGNMPRIAITSGVFDPEECLLLRMGIDAAEFTAPSGDGRVHLYDGGGATLSGGTEPAANLWATPASVERYDLVLFPCATSATSPGEVTMPDYANIGGRVFITDLAGWSWLNDGVPAWSGTATWNDGPPSNPTLIDQSFPKGKAMAEWLLNVNASAVLGQLPMNPGFLFGYNDTIVPPSLRWIYSTGETSVQTWSFNTPPAAPVEEQCGRVYYSSFHVSEGAGVAMGTFPANCSASPLLPQEKALMFLLFDATSCFTPDDQEPELPPVE